MTVVPNTFPRIRASQRMAIIGEAPGSEELVKGKPLVGNSGRILNSMLQTANIDRDVLFVGNVFRQKAVGNDVSPWMANPEIAAKARSILRTDLEKFRPNVIVPLGGTALWAFTGHDNIAAVRGNVLEATECLPGAKLLPTWHPMYIQKQWKSYVVGVGDLQKAWTQATYPDIRWPKKVLMVEPTYDEARDFIAHCHEADLLSVDIETGWGLITCIGLAPNATEAMCIPFVDMRVPNKSYWADPAQEVEIWLALRNLLADKNVPKLGQNFGAYDAHWLHDVGLDPYNFRHDTMLEHHALYGELEKSLAFMAARYTNTPNWKNWVSHNHKTEKKDDE